METRAPVGRAGGLDQVDGSGTREKQTDLTGI